MELERRYQVQLFIGSGITEKNVIANLTGHSPRTIRDIKKRLKEKGTIERKTGSGRPQKLNGRDKHLYIIEDLNIIENVWSIMKNKLEKSEKKTLSE
jgi:transposase